MLSRAIFTVFVTLTWISHSVNGNEVDTANRKERVFSLFSVVTFHNDQCTGSSSSSATTVYGTCFSSSECQNKGGTADGNCAAGFGVCCTFLATTCGSSVSNNCTYIQNPSYPASYSTSGACQYDVYPLSTDICQLRLDLDTFDITDTVTANVITGACVDTFTMKSGSGRTHFPLCGTLTGQHLYLETGRVTTAQELTFTLAAASTVGTWRIKVTQIECHSPSKAPADCLQYHTGISGTISSFNRPNPTLDDIEYSICFRRENGYCAIDYTAADNPVDSFQYGATATTASMNNCPDAVAAGYLVIHGSKCGCYSGGSFNNDCTAIDANQDIGAGSVRAVGGVFQIDVNQVIATSAANTDNLGFVLNYAQVPCGAISQGPAQA